MDAGNDERFLSMLRRINSGAVSDDANLSEADQATARQLYQEGLIWAVPLEGSDATVEALGLTEAGTAHLNLLRARWLGQARSDKH